MLILAALAWGSQAFAAEEAQRPQQFAEFDECRLASGEVIAPCRIGYRTYGALNADRSNAILVPTWFTGTSEGHAFLVSPQLLDPQTYFVVIVDALEAIAGVGMLTAVPGKLSQDIPREDTAASIEERGASYPKSIAETWDVQRQAEAMISHNIARDYDNDLEKAAGVIKAPFLIIVGEDDRVVTPGPALQFAPLIDAKVVVMDEDCGHGDPWCAPDKFADAVSRFIIGR